MQNAKVQNLRTSRRSGRAFERASRSAHPGLCFPLWTFAFCILHFAFSASAAPATGAKIDEARVANIYYVDSGGADAADDDKHGTQDSPFLTIKRAVDAAVRDKDANVGAKIIIGPGTYRESIDIPAPARDDTDAPLVIEAAERDQTIIDAADAYVWSLNTCKPDGKNVLMHPWPFRNAAGAHPPSGRSATHAAAGHASGETHAEILFLDGNPLRQASAPGPLAAGSFSILTEVKTAPHANAGFVTVNLPEDLDQSGDHQFQVGVRDHALMVTGRRNVVVRGLCFQHAANPTGAPTPSGERPAGLVFLRCSNVLVEDVLSQWNDGVGLLLKGSATAPWNAGVTLRKLQLIHNGSIGLAAENLKNVLAEDCETSFNDFRSEWAGTPDPQGAAGVAAHGIHGSTWRRQRAVGNVCRGLWWEADCTDLLVEDAVVRDNFFSGLLIENCPGPSTVRGCFVSGNKTPPGSRPEAAQPAAVSVEASPDVTLENNVVAGNLMPQLGLRDVAERTDGTDFETGAKTSLRAERHVYRHNLFYGADAGQVICDLPVGDRTGKSDFAFYYGTLDSDENCFWNPALAEAFCTYDRTVYRRPGLTLAGWRTFLMAHANAGGGQGDRRPETGSTWEDPRFMEPGEGDYRLQAQSPLTDWGLPSDEGAVAQ